MMRSYVLALLLPLLASCSWIDKYSVKFDHMLNSSAAFPASWQGMPLGDGDTVALTYMDGEELAMLIGKEITEYATIF